MIFKNRFIVYAIIVLIACVSPRFVFADSDSTTTRAREKYQIAISDYLEAIASCNGAIRKSAERQLNRVKDTCSMNKNIAHGNYVSQVQRLKNTYDQLAQYFDDPSMGKMLMDQVINAAGMIPGVGIFSAAYSATNTLYAYADEHIRSREGKDILRKAQAEFDALKQYDDNYRKWDNFLKEVSRRQYELDRQFDRNCVGRDTGEWRYNDAATIHQSGIADVSHSGNDRASGDIFQGRVRNNTGRTIVVVYLPGGWLIPVGTASQRMILTEGANVSVPPGSVREFPLGGFCADPRSYPPSPGNPEGYFPSGPQVFIPDGNPFNREFPLIPRVPSIVRELIGAGRIPSTGLPPEMEWITIVQWYVWNLIDNFNPEQGREKINEQVQESGGMQTPEQINELNSSIWTGVNLVAKRIREEATRTTAETKNVPMNRQGGSIAIEASRR